MLNIIKILPEHIANQIAAGEVIQRPSSVVKELIENAVDAGSTEIKLILKDAGKTLIQVIDNGCGMSEIDLRVSFERHATSKITQAEDLFRIKTKGFRGEAMASIASVAQVDIQSRLHDIDTGSYLDIQGSKVISQTPVAMNPGTNIQVKNLFFNIPARRKFLKSNASELRHCLDEFERVALVHPSIAMIFVHNGDELYHLPAESLIKRIIRVMGKNYTNALMPIQELTDVVELSGFVLKPEESKKTKGDQFLFVNDRFIKNNYLHHAIKSAFEEVIPDNYTPGYFIYMQVPADKIDINIHPTKTEIKFEDERIIYSILKSAVRKSIGQFGTPSSLDFTPETSFTAPIFEKNRELVMPKISSNPHYNPFTSFDKINPQKKSHEPSWKALYEIVEPNSTSSENNALFQEDNSERDFFELQQKYLVCKVKSGLMYIHIRRAWEKILLNRVLMSLEQKKVYSQQLLFPLTLELNPSNLSSILEVQQDLRDMGFDMDHFGGNSIVIRGIPSYFEESVIPALIQDICEEVKENRYNKEELHTHILDRILSRASAGIPDLKSQTEKDAFVDELFGTDSPHINSKGKKVVHLQTMDDIHYLFD